MFDKMRKGAFLLTLAGLAVATLTGSTAAAASSQPAVSAPAVDRGPAKAITLDNWGEWAPAAILYNQLDNPGANAINSQNFEAAYDAYDDFGADDFVIPANTSWTIKGVGVNGLYFNGPGPAASFNVFFHQDAGGLPADPPKVSKLNLSYTEDPLGTFKIPIVPALTIPASPNPRHVWVSVQANLDFAGGLGGQWGWADRSVLSNSPSAWKNPGGGFGVCPNWAPMAGCVGVADPDFQFLLVGTHTP
jgi:hypothetical protein